MESDPYERLKDEGNRKFKMKKYEEASTLYTQAISMNESGLLAYSNRAMCHINLAKFYEAKEDCDRALALDPKFTKAYYRRAIANKELYRFRDAIADLEKVIELDSEFTLAKKELTELQKQIQEDNRVALKVSTKPTHLQSTKPMKCFQLLNKYTDTKRYG